MREERNLNRARENYLEYAPQEPIDAMCCLVLVGVGSVTNPN